MAVVNSCFDMFG